MEKTGLITEMLDAVEQIAAGRLGFETEGREHDGMAEFSEGVQMASTLYTDAINSRDCELMVVAEYTFLSKELEFAEEDENNAEASTTSAIATFDDALLCLKAVDNKDQYQGIELGFPHRGKWRYNGYPNDAFHIACTGHIRRIKNGLSRFGVNRRDRALAELRIQMFNTAQSLYLEKQKKILAQ